MKNVILGMTGAAIVICLVVVCLSVYSISSRKNELENCVSQVLEQAVKRNFKKGDDEQTRKQIAQDLLLRLTSDSQITINVHTCDMEQGIISVIVTEEFRLPGGMSKTIQCSKTIIAEAYEENTESINEGKGEETNENTGDGT